MADRDKGTDASEGGKPPAGRGMKIVLILSLALNFFIVAIIAGSAIGHHRWGGHHGVRDVGFGLFSDVLSREDRKALRAAFLAEAPDYRDRREMAREEFQQLAEALRADPWDAARIDALIARHSARIAERVDLGRRLLVRRLEEMSPAERMALADRIDSEVVRGWRR